ncbi:uroporphyrinogen decarboxylase family protein [uncultured Paludibaculum sp.]|uniref:uroporphyrinogen decarboxylase family protein n=1 Tax=uncultured Paludibaculum sp. TaxID=1765020 RepID=UPI002AAA98C2|nr:uroporphyrinogen decarboxylase family protein [uncultured Paludibaculum sp.]
MNAAYYVDLARQGLRMPIGADLVLHEQADPESILHDAGRLGAVVESAARRYRTPLAFPLMDLRLEKSDLLAHFGVPAADVDTFHFKEAPDEDVVFGEFLERHKANHGAVRYIAERTDLLPVGMLIGPFSLMTKLVADPITGVALAASGVTAAEDDAVLLVERCLSLALAAVLRSAEAQMVAGARAIIVCEPAVNTAYLSPRQWKRDPGLLDRFVLQPNRQLRALLKRHGVDLILHDCGDVTSDMVERLVTELEPAVLSLGSSCRLEEIAAVVPPNVVLFGNLPTKTFYSDAAMPLEEVRRQTEALREAMRACGHPHILGSECDVLHVPDAAETIRRKVAVMLED